MPALAIGNGFAPAGTSGTYGVNSKSNVEDTITRLEQERDKYQKQRDNFDYPSSELLDRKIGDLEDRIHNLQTRLDKMKSEKTDGECETCKNRKYQDESNDPGVSFKTASKVSAGGAEAAVRGHEQEHVTRNQAKADREGKEVVYQSVIIKRAICPECGSSYVSGGETTTATRDKQDERFNVGLEDKEQIMGRLLNTVA